MNGNKLKGIVVSHGDSMNTLAEYLGITPQSLRNKVKGVTSSFKQGEISKIVARYGLTPEEIIDIFFN